MISYLPKIYPDELAYSWFCRMAVHIGFGTNIGVHRMIYGNLRNTPNKEFLGNISSEMRSAIEKQYSIQRMIQEHTMVPQYMRFYPSEEKKRLLLQIQNTALPRQFISSILRRGEGERYLRYCPLCVKTDREKYGEAYWHRVHQVWGVDICSIHNCRLVESDVPIETKKERIRYRPAEMHVNDVMPEYEDEETILSYSRYVTDIFWTVMEFDCHVPVKDILLCGLKEKGYLSKGGKLRLTHTLAKDMDNYFQKNKIDCKVSQWQIQRVLIGERFDFDIVCRLGFFLGVHNLTNPEIPQEVLKLSEHVRYKGESRPEFSEYDQEIVDVFDRKCQELYHGKTNPLGRPERVGPYKMEMLMGWPPCRLRRMPLCKAVMQKYLETDSQLGARRLVWAYKYLQKKEKQLIWYDFRRLTGLQREPAIKCLCEISCYTDENSAQEITRIITGEVKL